MAVSMSMSTSHDSIVADLPSKCESPSRMRSAASTASGATGSTISGSPTVSTSGSHLGDTSFASEEAKEPCSPVEMSEEMKEMTRKLRKLAVVPEDVMLGQVFADAVLIGKENSTCRQIVMRMIRMLRLCDYDQESIEMVLTVALIHLDRIFKVTDARMEDHERVSIAVLQCYNAHCYVLDEACPMKYWQTSIYASYCNVRTLNSAAYKLLKILKYNLKVEEAEVIAKRQIFV